MSSDPPRREPPEHLFAGTGTVRATRDPDVASAVLSDAYAELTIRVPAAAGPFGMRLEHVELPDVHIAVLDLSSAWLRTVPYPTYTVCLPVQGRVRVSVGDTSVAIGDGRGISVCPASGEVEVEYLSDVWPGRRTRRPRGSSRRVMPGPRGVRAQPRPRRYRCQFRSS